MIELNEMVTVGAAAADAGRSMKTEKYFEKTVPHLLFKIGGVE